MKSKLIVFIMVAGFGAQAEEFRGSVYNLRNGDYYVIDGTYVAPNPTIRERYQQMIAESDARIARMRAEYYASQQVWELQRQTELLEKIADK